MSPSALRRRLAGLSRNTYLLALTSLFADISTEMLYPVLPVFLTQTLQASGSIVGLIDGCAQAMQNFAQGFAGALSDRLKRRKTLALGGYFLAAISKPLMGLARGWGDLLGARLLDRLGAGTRSAPRDALVASSVDAANRGKAFGLEGAGDNAGACLGPLIAVVLLELLHVPLRHIFYVAVIPGLLAFLMVLFVRERPAEVTAKSRLDAGWRQLPKGYWRYLLVTGLFGLGNSSTAFLILRTQEIGASLERTILIYAAFNLVAALVSYPAGAFSDRFGRRRVLLGSFLICAGAYLGFARTGNIVVVGALFGAYGLFQGIFRAVGKAIAADFVPNELRASGLGWYSATYGLTQLIASLIAGTLWDRLGHTAVFYYGAAWALVGTGALFRLRGPASAGASMRH